MTTQSPGLAKALNHLGDWCDKREQGCPLAQRRELASAHRRAVEMLTKFVYCPNDDLQAAVTEQLNRIRACWEA